MNSVWEDYGIDDQSEQRRLSDARDRALVALRHLDAASVEVVLKEVRFVLFELPAREPKFQREYMRRAIWPRLSAADARGE